MRDQFRAAYEREFDTCPRGYIVETGEYTNDHARAAWWAWQASRAAAVVELPHVGDYLDTYQQGQNCEAYIGDLRAAIQSAGIRVK
jgi:hypothetical protein